MKIVIDRDIPYIKGVLEPYAEVLYLEGGSFSALDVADADALIVRTRTKCSRELLEGSGVSLIATATIGFDHIDTEFCRETGVAVATAAGSNARGVLQWVGAALSLASQQQGWAPRERCIGVVGVGNVGSLVASYARLWGFDVLCCDPPRRQARESEEVYGCDDSLYQPDEFVDFGRIISDCDIVTFHTPLLREAPFPSYHMAGAEFFDRVNPRSIVINSSRGEVVDTQALLRVMNRKTLTYCIDTWECEPSINHRLLAEALVSTPHIAGYSAQGKANATSMSVQAIARHFGLPLTEWYPYEEVPKVLPRPISWSELQNSIAGYFDAQAQSRELKEHPERFEELRNNYHYRTEYF